MTVTLTTRWDDVGTAIPATLAKYAVNEQPIAEYDNWFNNGVVVDMQAIIDEIIDKYNAHTILKADTDNNPVAMAVSTNTIVGRASGNIAALTAAQVRTLLNVIDGADVTADNPPQAHNQSAATITSGTLADERGGTGQSTYAQGDILYASAADTVARLTRGSALQVLRMNSGATIPEWSTPETDVVDDATPQLGGDLDLNGHEILIDTTPSVNMTASGIKGVFVNGNAGSVAFGDVCYMNSGGHMVFADADASTTMPAVAMALGTIAGSASGEWLLMGVPQSGSMNWLLVGRPIYVSLTGTTGNTLTQSRPTATGDQVQIVGYALTNSTMMFDPSPVIVEIA